MTNANVNSIPITSSSTQGATQVHYIFNVICKLKEEGIVVLRNNHTLKMTSPHSPAEEFENYVAQTKDLRHNHDKNIPEDTAPKQLESRNSQSTTNSNSTSSAQSEPYQELKWNDVPLFLNEQFDNPSELLLKGKQTLPIHAGRTALLVVDVQPEYWSQCSAVRQEFPEFPQNIQRLVSQCRQQKCKIIWVRADYRYAHSPWLVQFARLHQGKIPSEVIPADDRRDVEWEPFATPQGGEYVIPKTSWSSTRHTALMDLLKQSGIDTVLVCGLITSVCVQHSAFGIFEAGYRTLLVTDACADRGKARHDAALALYGDYMYELLTVDDLCRPDSDFYMHPAEPVWLTPHVIDTLVQPTFFNSLQDSVVSRMTGGESVRERREYGSGDDANDNATAMTSNIKEQTEYYKIESNTSTVIHKGTAIATESRGKTYSMINSTSRTSLCSLSTLSSRDEHQEQPIEL